MNEHTPRNPAWKLQDAKNRLSEVVRAAEAQGPQTITVRGERKAVLMSVEDFQKIRHILENDQMNFTEFLLSIPQGGSDEEEIFERAKARSRDIDF